MRRDPPSPQAPTGKIGFYDASVAGWYDTETGELAPGFAIGAADTVIDVGCGEGGFASFCGERGARVLVCDVDAVRVATTVEKVKATVAREAVGRVVDGQRLPFGDGEATRVLCTEVLEHVDDPAATMAEIARITAPGGLVLLTVPGARQERIQRHVAHSSYFEKPNHIRTIEAAELDALAEGAGLIVEHRGADGFFWSFWFANFWQFGGQLGAPQPTLDRWARLWLRVLIGPDGPRIKTALDAVLPKRQVLVARKPG